MVLPSLPVGRPRSHEVAAQARRDAGESPLGRLQRVTIRALSPASMPECLTRSSTQTMNLRTTTTKVASQLLQLATAVGFSLLMIIMICALVIVIMLHG
jgi:hypothetical protein